MSDVELRARFEAHGYRYVKWAGQDRYTVREIGTDYRVTSLASREALRAWIERRERESPR